MGTADLIRTDVCVIGGGPAGSAVALQLARHGHDVCLVERSRFPRAHVGESLPPSVLPLLDALALREKVEAASFLTTRGATIYWGGKLERTGYDAQAPGLQVDRARFDALLLTAAKESGVQVLEGRRAKRPVRQGKGWRTALDGGTIIQSKFVVDAAGRRAGLGRRMMPVSPPLCALYAYWDTPRGFGCETRIEAGQESWIWAAEVTEGRVNTMVFLDPDRIAGIGAAHRRDLYLRTLGQSRLAAVLLEGRRFGHVQVCDATCLQDGSTPGEGLLRAGEAAFTVDPLSSQGVTSALGQALQAAAVIHTHLTTPENGALAQDFYTDRLAERIATHVRLAAAFYYRQAKCTPTAFWQDRAMTTDHSVPPGPCLSPDMADHPLQMCQKARTGPIPIIDNGLIRPAHGLTHPSLDLPVYYLEGIRIAQLIDMLQAGMTARDIVGRWSPVIGTGRAGRVVEWLYAHRILVLASGLPRSEIDFDNAVFHRRA